MRSTLLITSLLLVAPACGDATEPGPSPAAVRAARRAFAGAPPVVPHPPFGAACTACHNERGMHVPEHGFAPASPHGNTPGMSDASRCQQCHVFRRTEALFVANQFTGLEPGTATAHRAHSEAPPLIPHDVFLRGDCLACHAGPGAREEIRFEHPERTNCTQCHVPRLTGSLFHRP